MKIIKTDDMRVPVKSWCNYPEESAIKQAVNLSKLPFVFKHVAIMPDTHCGYGMPIGGVLACKDAIIPNAVGVDIGCGMRAVKTNLHSDQMTPDRIKEVLSNIRKAVPVGFNHQKDTRYKSEMPLFEDCGYDDLVVDKEYDSAVCQLCTLGGGNHFCEIQKESESGSVWFMIHTGSRNLGLRVASFYNKRAEELNRLWYSEVDKSYQLAFLPVSSLEFHKYIIDMEFCLQFAKTNRSLISREVKSSFEKVFPNVSFSEDIDIHHNYVTLENHFGENVWIHRKGATRAFNGETGIIPGSQGTSSYIVRGLGNVNSFKSCSHGAGRRMSRTEAEKVLNVDSENKTISGAGSITTLRSKTELQEAPGAYKDIDVVMEEQKDLVEIVVKLTPMGVIKG